MKNDKIVKFPGSEEISSPFIRVVNWNYTRAKTMREVKEAMDLEEKALRMDHIRSMSMILGAIGLGVLVCILKGVGLV